MSTAVANQAGSASLLDQGKAFVGSLFSEYREQEAREDAIKLEKLRLEREKLALGSGDNSYTADGGNRQVVDSMLVSNWKTVALYVLVALVVFALAYGLFKVIF